MIYLTELAEVVALVVCWLCGGFMGAAVMGGDEAEGGGGLTTSAVATCSKMQF